MHIALVKLGPAPRQRAQYTTPATRRLTPLPVECASFEVLLGLRRRHWIHQTTIAAQSDGIRGATFAPDPMHRGADSILGGSARPLVEAAPTQRGELTVRQQSPVRAPLVKST